jgi:DNA primase catalytic core
MARLTDEEIDRIKRDTDLAAVVRSRGVALAAQGGDLVGLCPFHEDKTPSLHVTSAKGLWRCVSCLATGNVIQFVQRFDGVSFRHAADLLAGGAAFKSPPTCGPVKKSTVPRLANPLAGVAADDEHAADQDALRRVVDYYAERLAANPAALAYLEKRGLAAPELLKVFRVGFCDRTLGLRLPQKNRKEGAALRSRLERLGVCNTTGHEFFRGRITFPIVAADGAIGTIYGRAAGKVEKTERHRFLPGPQAGVFNPAALSADSLRESGGALILTEGVTDALTWWAHGWRNVTTCFSARKPSAAVLAAIVSARVSTVFLSFDPDGGGNAGTEGAAAALMARGVECRRVRFPAGHDANSYAHAVKPPRQALAVLLNAAEWLGKGRGAPLHRSDVAASLAAQKSEVSAPVATAPAVPSAAASPAPAPSSLAAKAAKAADVGASAKDAAPTLAAPGVAARKETASPVAPSSGFPLETPPPAPLPPPVARLVERSGLWFLDLDGPAREYRLCGLDKLAGFEVLKLTVRLRVGERFHLDGLDLAKDGERRRFVERAAQETALHPDLLKRDLGRLLFAVENHLAARLAAEKTQAKAAALAVPPMTAEEEAEALALLRAPDLLDRVLADFEACGVVGEENNKLLGYLAATSRLMRRPLAVLIQSSSAAGKTTLMDAVLAFMPPEVRIKYSAMTGQSLFYMGGLDLRHKLLAIVEEEGAEKASYALKLLQSEGELSIASAGKDPATGRMETQEYHVEGPVGIFLTTTAADIDEELQNRAFVLSVDESRAQTERIHALQREARTAAGLARSARKPRLLARHHAAQRLLKPLPVFNPYAPRLRFLSDRLRTRRDHEKYQLLIEAVTLLHQHQRARQQVDGLGDCVVTTLSDIEAANRLARAILGRSLDEMPPQTRRLLGLVQDLETAREKEDKTAEGWRRRDLRAFTGWGDTQLKIHLGRLVELEHVLASRDPDHGQGQVYELVFTGDVAASGPQLPGLVEVEELRAWAENAGIHDYDANRSGSGRPPVGGWSGGGRGRENASSSSETRVSAEPIREKPLTGGAADAAA